jgi:two-component system nitrogen regulation sensor histidine kinase NtrY
MVYRKLRIATIIHSGLILLWAGLFSFVLFRTRLYTALIVLGLLLVYQVSALVHAVDRANRDLARFFLSVRYGDFTQAFQAREQDRSFRGLNAALTEVMGAFRKARAEKEEQALYLRTVVQHIGIGLVVFQPSGEVDLVNGAAKRLLKIVQLKNIRNLEDRHPALVQTLLAMKPRERALVKAEIGDEQLQLSLYATEFKLHGQEFRLVSIQDIRGELEEKEIEAWQKLIRVLTHESMNSMTPISSMASTVQELVAQSCGGEGKSEAQSDIYAALRTIQRRSEGLLHFVDGYRNLARISKPNLQLFPVQTLFARIDQLLRGRLAESSVLLASEANPPGLELLADPDLIEQVLINLVLNAADAVKGCQQPRIDMFASLDDRGRPVIQVKDNGTGIAPENLDRIFIPFFSTKEGGSGIGLALSRQIMRLHNGSISVASKPGETIFTLRFKL